MSRSVRRFLLSLLSVAASLAAIIGVLIGLHVIGSSTPISRTYQISSQHCAPPPGELELCNAIYTRRIMAHSTLKVEIAPGADNCSSGRYHIYLDGVEAWVSPYLGWPSATGTDATLPMTTGERDFSPVKSGTHDLGIQPEGRISGCNNGEVFQWEAVLTVVTD